jgi:hypothetical protein
LESNLQLPVGFGFRLLGVVCGSVVFLLYIKPMADFYCDSSAGCEAQAGGLVITRPGKPPGQASPCSGWI